MLETAGLKCTKVCQVLQPPILEEDHRRQLESLMNISYSLQALLAVSQWQAHAVRWPSDPARHVTRQVLAAKGTLLKALHLSPGDHLLRFNVALVLQVHATS